MAIQPVDLQLAYLAAPQSAAVASGTQQAPAAAQAAAQAAFAAQVEKREETVTETPSTDGHPKIRNEREGGSNAGDYNPSKRRRSFRSQTEEEENAAIQAGGEKHFIDTTA
jgi:hypothetical protein